MLYNASSIRELHFIVNGKNATRNVTKIVAQRCVGSCLDPVFVAPVIEDTQRYWSKASSWPSGKVPLAGEDVTIDSGLNFIYDLEDSPIYKQVQINGRLTFSPTASKLTLRCFYLFVRGGELFIGNSTNPFLGQAKIVLYGAQEAPSIAYDPLIEAGNKVFVNTGLVSLYGEPRNHRTVLVDTAFPNDTQIKISPGLGWRAGEQIVLAATRIRWFETEQATILAYDNDTGITTLVDKLTYYHWG